MGLVMSKAIEAIYRNGRIELPPGVQLPENTRLTVIVPEDLAQDLEREDVARQELLRSREMEGKIQRPKPYTDQPPYVRHTPVPITGEPVSEVIVKQRGSR